MTADDVSASLRAADAATLRAAAAILQRRSTKPDGIMMRALLRVMRDSADKIEVEP